MTVALRTCRDPNHGVIMSKKFSFAGRSLTSSLVIGSMALGAGCGGSSSPAMPTTDGATTTASTNATTTAGSGGAGGSMAASGAGGGATSGTGGSGGAAPAPGCPNVASDPAIQQALPQATVDTAMPKLAGKITKVKAGGDLAAAIDAAQPGDTLELEAGATFTGPFTLPNKSGDGWVVIRTATPDADFAMPGARVSPALAKKMAKIVADSNPITVAAGAHNYRLIGLEVTTLPGKYAYAMVDLTVETTKEADLARDIILDRVYLHADPVGCRRGVALNSKSSAVIDSYLAGFREQGADSQAIAGWSGPGPYRIVNNYLEGASENIIFGGGDPSIAKLVPSDIQICGNHLKKDLAWKGGGWNVKNLFELKNVRRVLVAGNVMENNWADAQVGFAVVLSPRNQDGTAPWSTVEDLTFAYNIIRRSSDGLNLLSTDDANPSLPLARTVVRDNLWDLDVAQSSSGDGRAFQFVNGGGGGLDIKIDHNTTTANKNSALTVGDTAKYGKNFVFTNNLVPHGDYGVFGSEGAAKASLDFFLISYVLDHNAIFGGGDAGDYPAGNFFPASTADVGFAADWSLKPSSKYKSAGSDGKDLGADIAGLIAATKGVVQ